MDDFDEFGNFVGQEYSDSGSDFEDVEIVDNTFDEQPISEPLVKRRSTKRTGIDPPESWDFELALKQVPALNRFATLLGSTNHGKTSIFNWLMDTTTNEPRGLTTKCRFGSKVVSEGKSFVCNLVDTPGHEDFVIERELAIKAADSKVLVIDCVEGVPSSEFGTPDLVIVSKIDRLFFELKLPAKLAFERLDALLRDLQVSWDTTVFVSTKFRFSFSLASVKKMYRRYFASDIGNIGEYVIEPIFKLFAFGLIGQKCADQLLAVGISLSERDWALSYDERISLIMSLYFERPREALINAIRKLPLPKGDFSCIARTNGLWLCRNGSLEQHNLPGTTYLLYKDELVASTTAPAMAWFFTTMPPPEAPTEPLPAMHPAGLVSIAIEPFKPSQERSELLETKLRALDFPGLRVQSLETGEFVLTAAGELYLDTALNHIDMPLKVSQPLPTLLETCSVRTEIEFPTKNDEVSVTIVAEPFDSELADDELVCWAEFHGCAVHGPVTNPEFVDSVLEGIESCVECGPLIEAPVRHVRFLVLELEAESSFQLTATARRAAYSALLLAAPRLLEPEVCVSVVGKIEAGKALYSEIAKRQGTVTTDTPIYGTNLYLTEARVPLMDSFGLQLDILCQMDERDEATVRQKFTQYVEVTGDPLDKEETTRRMQVADPAGRARDFMLKIRRRKGLRAEPDLAKYVDSRVLRLII